MFLTTHNLKSYTTLAKRTSRETCVV